MSNALIIDRAQGKTDVNYQVPRAHHAAFQITWAVTAFLVCNPGDPALAVVEVPEPDFIGSDYAGCLAVQVQKSNRRGDPQHRFYFGSLTPDSPKGPGGKFVGNISPMVTGQKQGETNIDDRVWDALAVLQKKARDWQQADAAFALDSYVDRSSTPRNVQQTQVKPGLSQLGQSTAGGTTKLGKTAKKRERELARKTANAG